MVLKKDVFCVWVESQKIKTKDTYVDIILAGCEKFNIEPDMILPFLNKQILSKVQYEAEEMNYIKSTKMVSLDVFFQ